jgi:ABC-2 type transport system permease protein
MILVMVRVMALGLWRDRAGLVLVFVLPPLVFIVFATVFSAGASGRLDIRVGSLTRSAAPTANGLSIACNGGWAEG